MTISAVVSQSN